MADRLAVVERRGMAVNPLNRQFRLVSYLGVNYMLVAIKRTDARA